MIIGGKNVSNAVNQQGSLLSIIGKLDPSETTRRTSLLKAYLIGASHDGTLNKFHRTFRFSQKSKLWLTILKILLKLLGCKSWLYKEGKNRRIYVLETTAEFLIKREPLDFSSDDEKMAYVRGYFDSEGGVPHRRMDRFYIQLCQKNYSELSELKSILEFLSVKCGKIHNPSRSVDPNYWRFYVLARSRSDFVKKIGTWHPVKFKIFQKRMKI